MRTLLALLLLLFTTCAFAAETILSPNRDLRAEFELTSDGAPFYRVVWKGQTVLEHSALGLVRDDADFSKGLNLKSAGGATKVRDHYEILTAKRRENRYVANQRVFSLTGPNGEVMEIIFRVSNDGVAFRYHFPKASGEPRRVIEEKTAFAFGTQALAWLQPMSVAKTGFERTNPSYEEYYEMGIPAGTPSNFGAGWVFPGLFRTGEAWVAVSETGVGRTDNGSRLAHESPGGVYRIGYPDTRETAGGEPVGPVTTLPWSSPWRLLAIGDLATVTESMLGVDLAPAPAVKVGGPLVPGRASWSWPILGDNNTTYEVQKRFIDYAADMGWEYCLIDALWDTQIGYEKTKELADYAKTRNVGLLLWYNSNGNWNGAPQTPKDKLLTHEDRVKEFERLKAMGIKGLKIDFFGGDGQAVIRFYHDLLVDSAPYGLLMNFHGCTLPRGWQRTYPHLMTMEAIRGFEFVTFEQSNADRQPAHCAMLPFTRNLFDPMDFTPVCLDRLPRGERRTTAVFELALSVLFTSGIQHYPEVPEGMAKMPDYVREWMKHVPAVWDDVRLLEGFPGRYVALARRSGDTWYIAGINGETTERTFNLDLSRVAKKGRAELIRDGSEAGFSREEIAWKKGGAVTVKVPSHGGFVMRVKAK